MQTYNKNYIIIHFYLGKWVCVLTSSYSDNCVVYGNNKRCIECKAPNPKLQSDGTCV